LTTLRREALDVTQSLVTFFIEYACTDDASEALNVEDSRDYHSLCERLAIAAKLEELHNEIYTMSDERAQDIYDEITDDIARYATQEQDEALSFFFESHLDFRAAIDNVIRFAKELDYFDDVYVDSMTLRQLYSVQ